MELRKTFFARESDQAHLCGQKNDLLVVKDIGESYSAFCFFNFGTSKQSLRTRVRLSALMWTEKDDKGQVET